MTAQPSPDARQLYLAIVGSGHFTIDPTQPDERVVRALQELMNLGLVRKVPAFVPVRKLPRDAERRREC